MRQINKVVCHHSATPRYQTLEKSIESFNRTHKQRLHPDVNSKWYHLAYHFVVAEDGSYKQTRGFNEVGYHASNYPINTESLGICFIGNFDKETPTQAQYDTGTMLLAELSQTYKFSVHPHNEFAPKTCPGKNFDMNILKANMNDMSKYTEILQRKIEAWYSPLFTKHEWSSPLTEQEVKELIDIALARKEGY